MGSDNCLQTFDLLALVRDVAGDSRIMFSHQSLERIEVWRATGIIHTEVRLIDLPREELRMPMMKRGGKRWLYAFRKSLVLARFAFCRRFRRVAWTSSSKPRRSVLSASLK